jgi:hypothetical protein
MAAAASLVAAPAPAQGPPSSPPWDGNPISPGLGPTYGEQWCAQPAPGSSIANQQGAPLALIPQEAIECTLEQFEDEAAANSVPDRMSYSVIGQSAGGHDLLGVIVNAMETRQQRRDFNRWERIRAMQLTDPAGAQALLESYGDAVKMPIFIQANIHGNEEEGADAMMQVLRDLVTLPRGTSEIVDTILDHSILVLIPVLNPDGRLAGTRANGNGFDMNRDYLVQSQSEVRTSVAFQHEWLAPVGFDLHGYVSPTLVDGLTKPHNPGIEYDKFLFWNQRRLDVNEADLANVGMDITRPVNDWNQDAEPPGNPAIAEGWDDWGPFYTQTYMAFYGVDSSTVEMCSSGPGCDGRFGSKRAQYVVFYSSAEYWLDNRNGMMSDQIEVFLRGVNDEPRPNCCDDPLVASEGFTEDQHNWMIEYPTAYVIPRDGGGQRSDAEANRMVQWLLDNGIQVSRATEDFTWQGTTYPAGSYVVWMDQALRGLALTTLSAGQDISNRITQLYAPPGAWSHGLLWGADVIEVPEGDPDFNPDTTLIGSPTPLTGGIQGGVRRPSDWYAVTLKGVSEYRVVLDLLRGGVDGEVAEESFVSTTGGSMPAGTLIFPNDQTTRAALQAAGQEAGITFERNVGVTKPPTTQMLEAPRVAILVNSSAPSRNDTSESLRSIFGDDVGFVSVSNGPDSLENAPTDPLLGFDVIYNAGQNWPSNMTAQDRLRAFFERGGGYLATRQSANNFAFLTGGGLVQGSLTPESQSAGGGIALWNNVTGAASPVTGGYPAQDTLYLPSDVTYFISTPSGAVVDGRYHEDMAGTPPHGPSAGFVAGLWRDRLPTANSAPVIVHGATTLNSRYLGFATNPFSRQDAEREWVLMAQSALWTNLTDESQAALRTEPAGFAPVYPRVEDTADIRVPAGEKP